MEMALVKIRYKLFWQRVAKFFFIVIMMNGTFFENFLLQLSSLSDLRELRSALIVELSSIVSLATPLFRSTFATMYPMQKATSLPNNLTTLLLSLAISDVVVGLFAQSFYTFWSSGYNRITLAATLTKCWIFLVFFFKARFVPRCCGCYFSRFLGIHLHLGDQELVIGKRVVIVVISIYGCMEHLFFSIIFAGESKLLTFRCKIFR